MLKKQKNYLEATQKYTKITIKENSSLFIWCKQDIKMVKVPKKLSIEINFNAYDLLCI